MKGIYKSRQLCKYAMIAILATSASNATMAINTPTAENVINTGNIKGRIVDDNNFAGTANSCRYVLLQFR